MIKSVAIVGAGVSGLTCAVVFAERGYHTAIFAGEIAQRTTSGVAAALWFPYDAEPADKVIAWALETYKVLVDLSCDVRSGVSTIELHQFSRTNEIPVPDWAHSLGASVIPIGMEESLTLFRSGFAMNVPLTDTTFYLVINCAGIGARELVDDIDLEPHRGQVAVVPKIDNLNCAIVCDDEPLMYAIPRTHDCVFGGTNEISDNLAVDPAATSKILAECSLVLKIDNPRVLTERVGLRPFRKSGVRLERDRLSDGRIVVHNYGHGGSGFTLSWGCAENVLRLAQLFG